MTATEQQRFNQLQAELVTATERKDEANEALGKAKQQLPQADADTVALLSRVAYEANECVCDLEDKLLRLLHSGSETGDLPPMELCF